MDIFGGPFCYPKSSGRIIKNMYNITLTKFSEEK